MKKIVCLSLLLTAALASGAMAEAGKYSLSLMSGVSIPVSGVWADDASITNNLTDYGRSGSFSSAIAVDRQFNDNVALGMEIGRNWAHSPKKLFNEDDGDTHIWQFTPYAKVFKKLDNWTPYAILGAGLYSIKVDDLKDINSDVVFKGTSNSYLGVNLGGGITYATSDSWEFGVDVRWHHIFSNTAQYSYAANNMVNIAANNITTMLKLQHNFSL